MDLYYIDYISISGRSWLYRVPVGVKMLVLACLIAVLLWLRYAWIAGGVFAAVLLIAIAGRLPMKLFLLLTFYPTVFLIVIFLSTNGLSYYSVLLLLFRVLSITGAVVAFLLSTSYPKIFGALGHFLPGVLVAALFFTYRSIFVISRSVSDIRIALHLRGGINWRKPGPSIRNFGMALGHVLIHVIDSSSRKADSLRIRGFSTRIYYLSKRE